MSSRFFELFERSAFLYGNGASLQQVAEQVQVPKSTVRKALLAGGARLRPHAGTPEGRALLRKRQAAHAHAPYGYAFLDGKLTVHPQEIQIVRRILKMRRSGMGMCAIARELNAKTIRPRHAGEWDHSSVAKIVRRESDPALKAVKPFTREVSHGNR